MSALLLASVTGAGCGERDAPEIGRTVDGGIDAAPTDAALDAAPTDATSITCTLNMCRVNLAGTRACCFNDEFPPPAPYRVCCTGTVSATELCAYNPATKKYMTFCDYCLPGGWQYAASSSGTCP